MGTVSFEVPGPGTYQVTCDPKLDPLSNAGGAGDVLAGKQFYNDRNQTITGSMPNNAPAQVNVAGGESYTIPRGYHDGTGKVTGTGTVLPALTNPGTAGDLLENKQLLDGNGNVVTGTLVPGSDTGDATATAGDILAPKTAYVAAGKVTGTIPTKTDSDVTADGPLVAVPPGYYPQAVNKTVSDPDLVPGNIKAGVEIFGVTGTFAGGLPEGVRTITLSMDQDGVGTASVSGQVNDGQSVTVTATPSHGYKFSGWQEAGEVISTDAAYTFTASEDRSLVASFAVKPSRLPAGYTELEYIVTDVYCEINSGVKAVNKKAIIQMDIMYLGNENTSPTGGTVFSIFTTEARINTPSSNIFFLAYAPAYGEFYVLPANAIDRELNIGERVSLELNSKLNYVRIGSTSYTKNFGTNTTDYGNVVFGEKNRCLHMRIYSSQIYSDDTLTGDLVPCENSSGLLGLYNLVDNTFHGATNGTVTPGPAV